jgi:hypothetical protein
MSELALRLVGDATVRGTITFDGEQAFSVHNFINLICGKHGTFGNKVWERLIRWDSVYKKELDECKDEEEFIRKLTILNVRTQALNVCKTPFVQKAWSEGRFLHIHAWLMDIDTGLIHDLNITNNDWNEIRHIYDFIFH